MIFDSQYMSTLPDDFVPFLFPLTLRPRLRTCTFHVGCITTTWSWNWGRPHGFHLLLPEETKSSSFILDLWGAFLYIFCCYFIWKCFRNMNWRSLALYTPGQRTMLLMGWWSKPCSSWGARHYLEQAVQLCVDVSTWSESWPKVHWDCIDCIIIRH